MLVFLIILNHKKSLNNNFNLEKAPPVKKVQPAQHNKTKRYIFSNCRMEFGLNEEESKNINARILTKIIEVYAYVFDVRYLFEQISLTSS